MSDLMDIKQAARVVKDQNGLPVVQVPLDLWEAVMGEIADKPKPSQAEQIKALLKSWENEPDDKSPEWWAEFDQFLKDNRVNFPERDLGLGDE